MLKRRSTSILLVGLIVISLSSMGFAQFSDVGGIVLDQQTMQPLSDVMVSLNDFHAETDESGVFAFEQIPMMFYNISMSKFGYETISEYLLIDSQLFELNRSLTVRSMDAVIMVQVTDDNSSDPLAGTNVTLSNNLGGFELSMQTDPVGQVMFEDLYPENYNLSIEHEGYVDYSMALHTVSGENNYPVDLKPFITIMGSITNQQTTDPVVNAQVEFYSPSLYQSFSAVTNENGSFEIPGLQAGIHRVNIEAEGYFDFQTHQDLGYDMAEVDFALQPLPSAPGVIWNQVLDAAGDATAYAVHANDDGSSFVAGNGIRSGEQNDDVFLYKIDAAGTVLWFNWYGGDSNDVCRSMEVLADGSILLLGSTMSFGLGMNDLYLIMTDAEGNEEWSRTFGTVLEEQGESVEATSDGGFILAGTGQNPERRSLDAYVVKTDGNGDVEWEEYYGYTHLLRDQYYLEHAYSIIELDNAQGYVFAGTYLNTENQITGSYYNRINSEGVSLWHGNNQNGKFTSGMIHDVYQGPGGNILATGNSNDDAYLMELNLNNGTSIWNRIYEMEGVATGESVIEDTDGSLIIVGSVDMTQNEDGSGFDAFLMKADSRGNYLWSSVVDPESGNGFYGVDQFSDGSYIAAGFASVDAVSHFNVVTFENQLYVAPPEMINISGSVENATNGDNLIGAQIQFNDYITSSDRFGSFYLSLQPGTYSITVDMPGFNPYQTDDVEVETGNTYFSIQLYEFIEQAFELGNTGVMYPMVRIPAGQFTMGASLEDPLAEDDETPAHVVNIVQPFWIGKYELTREQVTAAVGPIGLPGDPAAPQTGVDFLTYFTMALTFNDNDPNGFWSLPSESQWEFAARAGKNTPYWWGNEPDAEQLSNFAWSGLNSGNSAHDVGMLTPNPWGVHDMLGNVAEFTLDDYHPDYEGAPDFGLPWLDEEFNPLKVVRGGAFNNTDPNEFRLSNRSTNQLDPLGESTGARLVHRIETAQVQFTTIGLDMEHGLQQEIDQVRISMHGDHGVYYEDNAAGFHLILNVVPGEYDVWVGKNGYADAHRVVNIEPGLNTLSFSLNEYPWVEFSGLVVDADTQLPLQNAQVMMDGNGAYTDIFGQYTLRVTDPGNNIGVSVSKSGYITYENIIFNPGVGEQDMHFVLFEEDMEVNTLTYLTFIDPYGDDQDPIQISFEGELVLEGETFEVPEYDLSGYEMLGDGFSEFMAGVSGTRITVPMGAIDQDITVHMIMKNIQVNIVNFDPIIIEMDGIHSPDPALEDQLWSYAEYQVFDSEGNRLNGDDNHFVFSRNQWMKVDVPQDDSFFAMMDIMGMEYANLEVVFWDPVTLQWNTEGIRYQNVNEGGGDYFRYYVEHLSEIVGGPEGGFDGAEGEQYYITYYPYLLPSGIPMDPIPLFFAGETVPTGEAYTIPDFNFALIPELGNSFQIYMDGISGTEIRIPDGAINQNIDIQLIFKNIDVSFNPFNPLEPMEVTGIATPDPNLEDGLWSFTDFQVWSQDPEPVRLDGPGQPFNFMNDQQMTVDIPLDEDFAAMMMLLGYGYQEFGAAYWNSLDDAFTTQGITSETRMEGLSFWFQYRAEHLSEIATGSAADFSGGLEPGTLTVPLQGVYFETVSSNLVPESLLAESVFGNIVNLAIVYQNDGGMFIPGVLNTINEITLTQGYKVFALTDSEWEVNGLPLDPASEYSITAGPWNWIGYPLNVEIPVEIGLNQVADQIVILQADDGGMWIPAIPINTLGNLVPGTGYMTIVTEDVNFTYAPPVVASAVDVDYWEIPAVEDAPRPTGLPYGVVVRLSDELKAMDPATISLYDGDTLVGKAAVSGDRDMVPVVAWEGNETYEMPGFVPGHPMTVQARSAKNQILGSIKTGAFGQGAYADVNLDKSDLIPTEFEVAAAYPNPFNPSVSVPFGLPVSGEVTFNVFNIIGQEVFSQKQNYEAGRYHFLFNASRSGRELVSGMYFLQVNFQGKVHTQKIMLLK